MRFRSPRQTGEPCRLVSLITCGILWPLQHCAHRKTFRSRDVICHRLGIKPHIRSSMEQVDAATPLTWHGFLLQWEEARRMCSWQESAHFWCAERYLSICRCSWLLTVISQLSSLSGRAAGWTLRWKLSQQRMWKREFTRGNRMCVCLQLCPS